MFSPDLREAVAVGEITVSIRLWSRPKVRLGGRYQTAGVEAFHSRRLALEGEGRWSM